MTARDDLEASRWEGFKNSAATISVHDSLLCKLEVGLVFNTIDV
jgi:hypothetical protein